MTARPWITRPDERETAVHECGHICALLRLGLRFDTIKIWQNDDGQTLGQVTKPSGANGGPIAAAICCLAGPIARQQLTGDELFELGCDESDIETADRVLQEIGLGGVAGIAAILPIARLLIERNWPDVERIAAALLVNRTLSYDEVVELIAG